MLAAGASARLGRPKQLLPYKGKSLMQHGAQVAIDTGIGSVIAVIGANADLLSKDVRETGLVMVNNVEWEEGMASSIRCGLQKLLEMFPETGAVILMVCDQPFVTSALLKDIILRYQATGKPIIASSYKNDIGTPALFDKSIFAKLLQLKGDTGAKRIIKENPDWVNLVDFPSGDIDIDTESDYERLMS